MSIVRRKPTIARQTNMKENKSVCFNNKLADFRLWHTNYSIFQHPIIASQEYASNCLSCLSYQISSLTQV